MILASDCFAGQPARSVYIAPGSDGLQEAVGQRYQHRHHGGRAPRLYIRCQLEE